MTRALILAALIGTAQAQTLVLPEGSSATITAGAAIVQYGAQDKWAYRVATVGTLRCTNQAAGGDPLVGVRKTCRVYLVNDSACTPRLMGGTGQGGAFGGGIDGVWHAFWCPSASGPRLRIMAGSWPATMEAASCINKSTQSLSASIRTCAPADVTAEPLRSIWSSSLAQIVSSKP